MKTKRYARRIGKLRIIGLCLAIATLVGIEVTVGDSLATRLGQAAARQTETPQAPNVDFSVLMAAMR